MCAACLERLPLEVCSDVVCRLEDVRRVACQVAIALLSARRSSHGGLHTVSIYTNSDEMCNLHMLAHGHYCSFRINWMFDDDRRTRRALSHHDLTAANLR